MDISQEIKKAIKFSRLELSEIEEKEYNKEIAEILNLFEILENYKTDKIKLEDIEFLPQKVINQYKEDEIKTKMKFEIDKNKISWGPKL